MKYETASYVKIDNLMINLMDANEVITNVHPPQLFHYVNDNWWVEDLPRFR